MDMKYFITYSDIHIFCKYFAFISGTHLLWVEIIKEQSSNSSTIEYNPRPLYNGFQHDFSCHGHKQIMGVWVRLVGWINCKYYPKKLQISM